MGDSMDGRYSYGDVEPASSLNRKLATEGSGGETVVSLEAGPNCMRDRIKLGKIGRGVPCDVEKCTIVSQGFDASPVGQCAETAVSIGKTSLNLYPNS